MIPSSLGDWLGRMFSARVLKEIGQTTGATESKREAQMLDILVGERNGTFGRGARKARVVRRGLIRTVPLADVPEDVEKLYLRLPRLRPLLPGTAWILR